MRLDGSCNLQVVEYLLVLGVVGQIANGDLDFVLLALL
jgi:hypothetical protein